MKLIGNNQIIQKDNNVYNYEYKNFTITGEKIIEMIENHQYIFLKNFGDTESISYIDINTIYLQNNKLCINGSFVTQYLLNTFNQKIDKLYAIDNAAVILGDWGKNYYHILTEEIPNLIKINTYNNKLPFIMNYNETYIKDILSVFKFENPIVKLEKITLYNIRKCYTTNISSSGKPSKYELELVRNYLINKNILKMEKQELGVIIYRIEDERRLLNHNDMLNYLNNKYSNIKWVVFHVMSFLDTINLFSKAKIIIAPHGAGLTNMMFSPTGCNIIELMPYSDPNECYYHLSSMLDHNYYCIVCNDTGRDNKKNMNIKFEYLDKVMKIIKL
jgi:capsular polysaccharide biosynthesis protein